MTLFKLCPLLILCLATISQAVDMKNDQCWKGYSDSDQQSNLSQCDQQKQDLQICSTNLFENKQGAYDVCLMGAAANPTKTVSTFKGYNQQQQDQNLQTCEQQRQFGQLCVSNAWISGAGVYDVILME
jgi:hypothetical protein